MSYCKCKNISIDVKKEIVKVEVAESNISPLFWYKYEYVGDTFKEKIAKICFDWLSGNIQFQNSVCKKEVLAMYNTAKLVEVGQYPFKKEKVIEFAEKYIEILSELKQDKTLSKEGYIRYSKKDGNGLYFLEKYSANNIKVGIFGNKTFTRLYYLLLKEKISDKHYIEFDELEVGE